MSMVAGICATTNALIGIDMDTSALKELVAACEREFIGDVCQDEPDKEPVAAGTDEDGFPYYSEITFGMIRRARAALQ